MLNLTNLIERFKKILDIKKISQYFKNENAPSENLNTFMRKKQNVWGCVVIITMLLIIFVLHDLSKSNKHQIVQPLSKNKITSDNVPDGVLSDDFTQKNNLSALEEQQQQIDLLNKNVEKLSSDFLKKNNDTSESNATHATKETTSNNLVSKAPFDSDGKTPVSSGLLAQNGSQNLYPMTTQQQDRSLNKITFHYASAAPNHISANVLSQRTYSSSISLPTSKTPKTWVPAGTFDRVVLLVGADANASVNGQSDTVPILMRFLDQGTLPNGFHSHLKGCFALASVYGDISSERGEARLHKISCTKKDGSILEMPVEGFISFAGKEGIRGRPVMRNGKILTMAGISGALSGFGSPLAQGAQTQSISPLGVTTTVTGSQVFKSGAYTGASTAMGQLASYYIKRADQYHPVIDIGSGTVATVVFQTGFSLIPKSKHSNQAQNSVSSNSQNNNSSSNVSEIKALLKEEQNDQQQKIMSAQNEQQQQSNDSTSASSAPFSNVSQVQLGSTISNNGALSNG